MISRLLCVIACSSLSVGLTVSAQQSSPVPLNDTPPTLSLPPLPTLPKATDTKPQLPPPALASPVAPAKPLPTNNTSSTSGDGQFVIRGADLTARTWFSTQCEAIATDLRKLLRDPAPWSIPIVISVRTAPNISLSDPAVQMRVTPLAPAGFQLQVTVQMRADFNSNDFRTELIRLLLAERILRSHDQLTSSRRPILPEWFFTGVNEALRFRERARPSATFAAVFKSGKVYGIEEILGASPTSLDALSKAIYETSSCALVLMLLEQPEGNLRMAKFLSALATDSRSDRDVLNQWFPGLAQSKTSLDKWWSLQMAHLSRPSVWETLDPQETAKALELALAFHYESEIEVSDEPARPKSKPATKDKDDEEKPKASEEDQRSFFGRIFSNTNSPSDSKADAEKAKPKPEPEKKPEPKKDDAQKDNNPGLLTRMFGGSDEKPKDTKKEEKKPEKKAEPKPAPKKEEPTKKADKPDAAPAPGLLRRFFSGDKDKAKEDAKKAEPDKKSASLAAPLLLRLVADITLPRASILFDAHDFVRAADDAHAVILGFGKKKDDKEELAKAEEKKKKEAEAKRLKDDAKKAEAAKREEEAKAAAAKKAAAKKEKDTKADEKKPEPTKEESKKEEPKKEAPKKAPPPAPKPVMKKRKVIASAPIEDYAKILKRSDGRAIVGGTVSDLSALQQRAHPLFQPIIADYISLIAQIANGSAKTADADLKTLHERTANALKQARAVQDHLDWYEASQNTKWSGLFDDFLRVKETIQKELPKRTDPLSQWLDEVEKQGATK